MFTERKTEKHGDDGGKKNGRRFPVRPLDIVIILAVTVLSLAPLLFIKRPAADTVAVSWHGSEIYRGSLKTDAVITTPDGRNTIKIENGEVYMLEADCRDRLCLNVGQATPARPIVCLPNGVVITLIGSDEADSVSW